jgi:hypothetical protein
MEKSSDDQQERLRASFNDAHPQVKQVVLRVFEIENSRLYMGRPHGVIDEITQAIKQIVSNET